MLKIAENNTVLVLFQSQNEIRGAPRHIIVTRGRALCLPHHARYRAVPVLQVRYIHGTVMLVAVRIQSGQAGQ